jgi:DNA invertase Pin-like site-specific DNA recombinase
MHAAMYARISRDDAGDGLGVQRQLQDCAALVKRRGWINAGRYIDNDVSAFSGRVRPQYERLLNDIRLGRIDVVIAWAPERLHRSPRELEDFIDLIEQTGVAVETVKAGTWDVSSSHGRLVARMLGAVSRAESERTGERVSRAHRQAQERGCWRGPIPFGMQASGTPGLPEPDDATAEVVRGIYARVRLGDALTRIATDLNAAGVRPARGKAWTHTGISRLIASPALGGMVSIDGEFRRAAFQGVVDTEEWHAARAALRRRPRGASRRPREKLSLLGGILRCEAHGYVCVGGSASHAATYVAGMPGQCFVSITRDAADLAVTELVVARLNRPDAADLLQPRVDHRRLDEEASSLRRRRDELAELIGDGLLPATATRPKLAAIADRLAEIESSRTPSPFAEVSLTDARATWTSWTMPQRREVLSILFDKITVRHVGQRHGPRADPTRIDFVWAPS